MTERPKVTTSGNVTTYSIDATSPKPAPLAHREQVRQYRGAPRYLRNGIGRRDFRIDRKHDAVVGNGGTRHRHQHLTAEQDAAVGLEQRDPLGGT